MRQGRSEHADLGSGVELDGLRRCPTCLVAVTRRVVAYDQGTLGAGVGACDVL